MQHIKIEGKQIVILTPKEVQIISSALNNRMVLLSEEKKGEDSKWAEKEWDKCLELQCKWFEID